MTQQNAMSSWRNSCSVCIDTSSEQPQLFDDLPLESSSPIASLLTEPSYESISSSDAKKVVRTNSNSTASPLNALVVERALEVSKAFMCCRCFCFSLEKAISILISPPSLLKPVCVIFQQHRNLSSNVCDNMADANEFCLPSSPVPLASCCAKKHKKQKVLCHTNLEDRFSR